MENDAHFEFRETKNPSLIASYIELRRRVYRDEYPWLPEDFGQYEATDRVSAIVLAIRANNVAGGARLTVSTPDRPRRMPLEEADFTLRDCPLLMDLNLHRRPYGEISRMAIDPSCSRGFQASLGLGNALCAIAAGEGLDVVFSICPEGPARLNRINAKRRGVGFHQYCELPTVFGHEMWLCAFTGLLRVYGRVSALC